MKHQLRDDEEATAPARADAVCVARKPRETPHTSLPNSPPLACSTECWGVSKVCLPVALNARHVSMIPPTSVHTVYILADIG